MGNSCGGVWAGCRGIRARSGKSLVEMLVVLAIILIVGGIVVGIGSAVWKAVKALGT